MIPESGRSAGERIGYPLQYSWASLVTQLVKNPPAMWEIWVQSLDWEDPLEKGKATHSSILAWRIPCLYSPWGCKESDMTEQLSLTDLSLLTVFDLTYGLGGCNFNHPCSLLITIMWNIFSIHLLSAYMYPENCTYLINLKHHKRK